LTVARWTGRWTAQIIILPGHAQASSTATNSIVATSRPAWEALCKGIKNNAIFYLSTAPPGLRLPSGNSK